MKRSAAWDAASAGELWDVVVIGGGASGFGAAVDAAARGFRTLLLEQHDFSKATSSRSTKLVHGGVRYLKQGRVGLVRESLIERGLLLRNAPHVCRPLGFIVPTYTVFETAQYAAGLKAYDLLAGRLSLGSSTLLRAEEVSAALGNISTAGLRGGVRYFDGQFDDSRLIVTLARTLFDLGGFAINYAPVVRLAKDSGKITGVVVRDAMTARELEIRARVVINATGVFTDVIRRADDADAETLIAVSQGAHIVLDRSFLPGDTALMIPKTSDGRVLFAIPWLGYVVVGTTDIERPDAVLEPRPLAEEIAFILENASRYLARAPSSADIRSAFAGLRPLVRPAGGKSTADISRDFSLTVSSAGLLTLTGGKWTTYRRMGEAAVDQAISVGGLEKVPCRTKTLALHGANGTHQLDAQPSHWRAYGSDQADVMVLRSTGGTHQLHPRLSYEEADVRWAARHEMALTIEDVLARRTRMLFLDAGAAIECAPKVAAIMASELQRPREWQEEQVREFTALARGYLP